MLEALKNQPRFSFLLGGKDFKEHSPSVKVETDGSTTKTMYIFDGGLRMINTFRVYPEFGACDWVNEWENTGDAPTDIISELWDCDVELPFPESEPKTSGRSWLHKDENVVKVYVMAGGDSSPDAFSYGNIDVNRSVNFPNWFVEGSRRVYGSKGGRSSDGLAPFFHIKHGKENLGVIAAVGWTGQWNTAVERKKDSVIFRSKIEDTNFRILPGECFRTSSVTLMPYCGTMQDGQNKWRRLVRDVYSPIRDPEKELPFSAMLWGGTSTEDCLEVIKKIEATGIPYNTYWMDAGWYGAGVLPSIDEHEGDWSQHVGNWEVNRVRHPDLLLDVASAIEKTDKQYLLWFEPERVRRGVPLVKDHPEYLIIPDDERNQNILFDLGNEEAWQYCFNTLVDIIARLRISVYRQDFNFAPLGYWRLADTPERVGITEIKHINGLYRLWDALLERFPGLLIDNCASGGRRIDVETLRRSVPMWRSDAQCPVDPTPYITQNHAMNYGSWLPYSGTGTGRCWFDTYRFRSAYAPIFATGLFYSIEGKIDRDEKSLKWLWKMVKEFLRVRPYLYKDIYPLTSPSGYTDTWSAVQYHDPDEDAGVLQVFRREKSMYPTADLKLYGLSQDKEYIFEDADGGTFTVGGNTLLEKGLSLTIKEKRTAKVYFYKAK